MIFLLIDLLIDFTEECIKLKLCRFLDRIIILIFVIRYKTIKNFTNKQILIIVSKNQNWIVLICIIDLIIFYKIIASTQFSNFEHNFHFK